MDSVIVDLLSTREIAVRVGVPHEEVKTRIAFLGLDWVRARERMSRGHAALFSIMEKLLPGEDVVTEYSIGERLKLDVYCPKYQLAAEFHGQQHFAYVEHFHGDMTGFLDSQRRDARKIEICQEKGVALVAFNATDKMTEDAVFRRLLVAMQDMDPMTHEEKVKRIDPYREAQLERQRKYRKQTYRMRKQERGL
jgi:hypothetical protein